MPSRFICFYDAAQLTLTPCPGRFVASFPFEVFAPQLAGTRRRSLPPTCLTMNHEPGASSPASPRRAPLPPAGAPWGCSAVLLSLLPAFDSHT